MTKLSVHDICMRIATKLVAVCGSMHSANYEAWLILEHVTKKSKAMLLAHQSIVLVKEQERLLDAVVHQRVVDRKPLNYILGSVPFVGLEILVEPPILIPRPETEEMVTWIIQQYAIIRYESITILDLCTGSGCIALALAKAFPRARVMGIDINPHAIALAQKNQKHNAIENVIFQHSDLYGVLDSSEKFDLIVSNPPYVSEQEYRELCDEVTQWEDVGALVAADQGLALYRRIIKQAPRFLTERFTGVPRLVLELGTNTKAVEGMLIVAGFTTTALMKDMQRRNRWIAVC